jgi:hypothetical protein
VYNSNTEDPASQPAQGSGLPSQVAFSASKSSIVAIEPVIQGTEDKVHVARVHPNFWAAPPQLAPGWSQMSIETQSHVAPAISKSPNHQSEEGFPHAPQPTHQGSFVIPKSFTTPKVVPITLNSSKPQDILAPSTNIGGQKEAHNQATIFNSNLESVQPSKEYSKPTSFPSTTTLDPQGAGIVAQSLQRDKAKDAENQVKPYPADPASSKLNHDSNPKPSQQVSSSLHPPTSHPIQSPLEVIHHPKLAEILSSPPPIHRSMTPARVYDNAPRSAAAVPFPGVMDAISRSSPSFPVHVLTSKADGSPSDRARTTPLVSRDAATPKHSPSRRQIFDPSLNEQTLSQPMPHSTSVLTSNSSAAATSLAKFAAPVVSLSGDSRLPDLTSATHIAPGSHRVQTRNLPSRVASNVVDTTSSNNDQKYTQAQAPIETATKSRPLTINEIHPVTNYHNSPGRKLSGTVQANSNDQTIHRNRPSGAGVPPPILTSSVYPQPDIAGSQTTFSTFSSTTALRHKQSASLPSNMPPSSLSQSQTTARVHQTPQISGRNISTTPYRSRELAASEETILMTPSSLAPSMLKPTVSRTSITPSTIPQQESRKQGKMFDMLLPKKRQEPQPVYEVWHPPSSSRVADRVKAPTSVENLTQMNPSTKVAASSSSRVKKPPPISVPSAPKPIQRRKSPNSKVFTPFRYLTSKRNRTMSSLSLEAQDGTAVRVLVSVNPSDADSLLLAQHRRGFPDGIYAQSGTYTASAFARPY